MLRKGSHFTYEERIQLEFYLSGTGKLPKVTNKVMLGTFLQKSPRTIAREIQRGQVEHYFDEGLQTKMVYNADYAEHKARDKDSGKGPQLKLGYDFTLAQAIGELIREKKYSPFAVLAHFNNTGRPTETRICEKTLYNYIYEGLIPNVSEKIFYYRGKVERLLSVNEITGMHYWQRKVLFTDQKMFQQEKNLGIGKEIQL